MYYEYEKQRVKIRNMLYVCMFGMVNKKQKNWNLKKWEGDSYTRLGNGGGRHN